MGFRIADVALASLDIAVVAAAPANAARGMEIGLQDDSHCLDEDAAGSRRGVRARSVAARIVAARERPVGVGRERPAREDHAGRRELRLLPLRPSGRRGGRPRHLRAADANGRRTGVGDARPQDLRRPSRPAALRRVRRGRRFALQRARARAVDLERAELARAAEARAPVREGVQEGQGQRQGQVGAPPAARVREDLRAGLPEAVPGGARGDQAGLAGLADLDRRDQPVREPAQESTAPLAWVRQLACVDPAITCCTGGALRADGYAHHPYSFDRRPGARARAPTMSRSRRSASSRSSCTSCAVGCVWPAGPCT